MDTQSSKRSDRRQREQDGHQQSRGELVTFIAALILSLSTTGAQADFFDFDRLMRKANEEARASFAAEQARRAAAKLEAKERKAQRAKLAKKAAAQEKKRLRNIRDAAALKEESEKLVERNRQLGEALADQGAELVEASIRLRSEEQQLALQQKAHEANRRKLEADQEALERKVFFYSTGFWTSAGGHSSRGLRSCRANTDDQARARQTQPRDRSSRPETARSPRRLTSDDQASSGLAPAPPPYP